jgi:signal peptidase II
MAGLLAALAVIGMDQLSKYWIRSSFGEEELRVIWQNCFNLTYVRNRGGAFGIFPYEPMLFVILSLVTIAILVYFYKSIGSGRRSVRIAIGLIIGGAVGNLIDRIAVDRDGCVIDWLDFHWGAYHWPAFNIADSAICVGVFILFMTLFLAGSGKTMERGG